MCRGEVLLMASHWLGRMCFLLCYFSFIFPCYLTLYLFSSFLVSRHSSFPLLFPCWGKESKQWTFSLIYLWIRSCIIQLSILLNKMHSERVIESNLYMLGLWFMSEISSRAIEGSFWPWTVTFAVLKETFYFYSPFNLLLAHGLDSQSSTDNPVTLRQN